MNQPSAPQFFAIIGMGCRFPRSPAPAAFEQLLVKGLDGITQVPSDRWSISQHYHPEPQTTGKTNSRWGGFLEQIGDFDPHFFNISPKEATRIDPQQRLVMEVSWECLENAGIAPISLKGSQTGVFVGIGNFDYGRLLCQDLERINAYHGTGLTLSLAANRVSYFLDLHGPSLAVETACSSSLVAVHLACQSLQQRECDLALAGGVSLMISPDMTITFSQAQMMSGEGRCKTFDAKADGYVRGEGCGMIAIKRLSDALETGDRLLAIIRGSAINHDGASNGLTAPNGLAQQAVIKKALKNAGIYPNQVSYLEAHGTGTPLGDPVEIRAIKAVLEEGRKPEEKCAIGSVKTNIGHLENAAGIAGIIKVILSLQKRQFFPHLHLKDLNPHLEMTDSRFFIPTENQPWVSEPGKRIAGVSGFSFGGTNCHIILEEAPESVIVSNNPERLQHLLTLSAKTEPALKTLAYRYHDFLHNNAHLSLGDICWTANTGRSHFKQRLAVFGKNRQQIGDSLQNFLNNTKDPHLVSGEFSKRKPTPVVFLFTGQGSQYWGMGKQLYETQPTFRRWLQRCEEILEPYLEESLLSVLYSNDSPQNIIQRPIYTQTALFSLEYALAQMWLSWGIKPAAMIGHSLGEYVAACLADVFTLEEGLKLIAIRAKLIENLPEKGRMVAVFASEDLIKAILMQLSSPWVVIGSLNGEENTVISGRDEPIEKIIEILEREGIKNHPLTVSHGFHSPLIEPILEEWQTSMADISFQKPKIPLISNLTGKLWPEDKIPDGNYWGQQTCNPVRFKEGIQTLLGQKYQLFLEIGAKPILSKLGQRWQQGIWLPSLVEGAEDWTILASSMAHLSVQGAKINWKGWDQDYHRHRLSLPTYPFQRQFYWLEETEKIEREYSQNSPNYLENPQKTMTDSQNFPKQATDNPLTPEEDNHHKKQIIQELRNLVANLLDIDPSKLDYRQSFLEMGADSLVLLDVVRAIENNYGLKINISQLFEVWATIEALGEHIAQEIPSSPILEPSKPEIQEISQKSLSKPLLNSTLAETNLERIITQQLEVMSQQLALLQGKPLNQSPKLPVVPQNSNNSLSLPETEKKKTWRQTPQTVNFTPQQQNHVNELIKRYNAKTAKSKAKANAFRPLLADSRAVAGFRPSIKELLYPIVGEKAQGSRFWDIDGNEYLDITMGFGVLLLGHNAPVISQAIAKQLEKGLQIGPQSNLAAEVAQLIQDLTGVERVLFCNSGTEAVMTALRLARTVTGRRKIALFRGSYHGHFDGVLAVAPHGTMETVPMVAGITENAVKDVLMLEYDSPRSLEILSHHQDDLAAVLVEPVPSRRPHVQPKAFLQKLRTFTQTAQIPLIFDEVLLGFRIHPGGAQKWFGIEADLVTYGKIVGGGLPIGVVAGKSRYLDAIDGGEWNYGDNSYPRAEKTFFAGTFNKNHLGMAGAYAILQYLKEAGEGLQQQLNRRTTELANQLNHYFEKAEIPLKIVYFGSLFRFSSPENLDLLYYHLLEKGIYIWEGRNCFLSSAHTDEDIDFLKEAIKSSVIELREGGFFPTKKTQETINSSVSANRLSPNIIYRRLLPLISHLSQHSELQEYPQGFAQIEKLSLAYIIEAFEQLGINFIQGEKLTPEIKKKLGIMPSFSSLWQRLLEILAEEDIFHFTPSGGEIIKKPEIIESKILAEEIATQYPFLQAEITLLNRCGSALAEVLQGKVNPLQLIFPQGDLSAATQLYKTSPMAVFLNTLIEKTVSFALDSINEGEKARILEIGAGTGGTTAYIVPNLSQTSVEYYFTDLSPLFINRAKQVFHHYSCLHYGSLDIEQEPHSQDLGRKTYHIIIAANVIHSTANLIQSLKHIHQLLMPGGIIILMEGTSPQRWLDLIFGLTEGWWKFTDQELRPSYPLISVKKWQKILQETGFTEIISLPTPDSSLINQQSLIIARSRHQIPLTLAQKQLWTLAQLQEEGSVAYNDSLRLELTGKLDIKALNQAIQTIVNRHEALRILIDVEGETQEILPQYTIEIPYLDFSKNELAEMTAWLNKTVQETFNMSDYPPLRWHIVKVSSELHWLVLTIHHIISDGWSIDLMMQELAALYNAQKKGIKTTLKQPDQFSEYVSLNHQTNLYNSKNESYWLQQFNDIIPQLDLPMDFPRPPIQTYQGKQEFGIIESSLKDKIKNLEHQQGVTLFMILLAIFDVLLQHLSQQNDRVIGISAAGQLATGRKKLVGYCVNVLPVRFREPKTTFSQHLAYIKQTLLEAYEHQTYPYSQLLQKLKLKRDPSRPPLINVQFNLDKFGQGLQFTDLDVKAVLNFSGATRRDLTWNLAENEDNLTLTVTYNADLFKPETIQNWIEQFISLLKTIIDNPNIPLLTLKQKLIELEQRRQFGKAEQLEGIAQKRLKRMRRKTNS
ncbi:MAG: aminotransferase class III-fold pyridoxal phosphate-dependent enzyme [Crocosphaera sp.]|nr:aminotransferase class III-fold pyridoxal phosphate-dependent enzyme [Crocosphaera sp.]